jgi:SSS family solute:Na+ symporter
MIAGFVVGIMRLGAKVFYTQAAKAEGYSDVARWAADNNVTNFFYTLFYEVNWLFFSGGMLLFSIIVILVVSRFTPSAPDEQLVGLTYGSATDEQLKTTRASWDKWDVIHTAIILAFTLAFYSYFW